MFRLPKPDEVFPTPCTVKCPDGAQTLQAECTLHFVCLPSDEARTLTLRGNVEFLKKALVGWGKELLDTDGEPMPFTESNRDRMIRVPYFAASAVDAYFERFHLTKNF